jgi:hypothetical protein
MPGTNPPSLSNQHGTFQIGEWVAFTVDRPGWAGDTSGTLRYNGKEFFIRTPTARLPVGPNFVREDSIRLPAAK